MRAILRALATIATRWPDVEIVYPAHPNPEVRRAIRETLGEQQRVRIVDPLGYGAFVTLLDAATLVLTDSGGIQEEAPALGKPVLVMRDETERPEAVTAGVAALVGTDEQRNRRSHGPPARRSAGVCTHGPGRVPLWRRARGREDRRRHRALL